MFKSQIEAAKAKAAQAIEAVEPAKAEPAQVVAAVFTPDGEVMADFGVRYKVLCDGGLNPSGVFWEKTVPPVVVTTVSRASDEVLQAVQAERDEALARLAVLVK